MADLGSIAIESVIGAAARTFSTAGGSPAAANTAMATGILKSISMGGAFWENLRVGVARNNTEGSGAQPSLSMDRAQTFQFLWPVSSGSRKIWVSVKQSVNTSPRPRLSVLANPDIGVNSTVTGDAGAGSGWVVIGPVNVNPTSDGVLVVQLENRLGGIYTPCYFDQIVVS